MTTVGEMAISGVEGRPSGRISRRPDLLRATIRCVARYGIGATTAQIADAAGLPKSTIHYYFRDKTALIAAAFDEVLRDYAALVDSDVPAEEPPERQLERLMMRIMPIGQAGRERVIFWFEVILAATRTPEFVEQQREFAARSLAAVEARLRGLQADGRLPQHLDPADTAVLMDACVDGLAMALVKGVPPMGVDDCRRVVRQFVRRLCAADQ